MSQTDFGTQHVSRPRFQFGLRTLFLLMAVCSLGCYWIIRPTFMARRFATAVQSNDFPTLNSILVDRRTWATDAHLSNLQLTLEPLTFGQLARGERWFSGYIPRGEKMEDYDWHLTLKVTASEVEPLLLIH